MKTVFKHTALVLVAILSFSLSFAQVELATADYEVPKNKAELTSLANNLLKVMIEADFDQMADLLSDDFQILGAGPEPLNKQGYINLWKSYHRDGKVHGMKDGMVIPINLTSGSEKGEALLVWGEASWTPNGLEKPVSSWMHMTLRVRDGKVHTIYNFENELAVLMQMGFKVVPPSNQAGGK